jgi:hypothetical protein
MLCRYDRFVGLCHCAVWPDQHRYTRRIALFRGNDAVSRGGRFVSIGQQIIRKIEFIFERLIVGIGIKADTENYAIFVFEVLDSITEPIAFDGSARGIGLGIPPHQNILS